MSRPPPPARFGPWIFAVTLAAVLVFFWWFLIYRHGVPAGMHGG